MLLYNNNNIWKLSKQFENNMNKILKDKAHRHERMTTRIT
jgi:hypothetical protein